MYFNTIFNGNINHGYPHALQLRHRPPPSMQPSVATWTMHTIMDLSDNTCYRTQCDLLQQYSPHTSIWLQVAAWITDKLVSFVTIWIMTSTQTLVITGTQILTWPLEIEWTIAITWPFVATLTMDTNMIHDIYTLKSLEPSLHSSNHPQHCCLSCFY